jgi:lysozyme family protein
MATFEAAIPWVLDHEGGFQKNPKDRGNYYNGELLGTKYGITVAVAREDGYTGRMEDLPLSRATSIYERKYWPGLDFVNNQQVATKILDMRVQYGKAGGDSKVQEALVSLGWDISVDGVLGPISLSAINQEDPAALLAALVTEMESEYRGDVASHPDDAGFLGAWLERARDLPPFELIAGGIGIGALAIMAFIFWKVSKEL